jgi:hypothetical protein
MKTAPRSEEVSARTDKETIDWIRKIAKNEGRTISSVIHFALKKAKANFPANKITRET